MAERKVGERPPNKGCLSLASSQESFAIKLVGLPMCFTMYGSCKGFVCLSWPVCKDYGPRPDGMPVCWYGMPRYVELLTFNGGW